MVWGSFRGWKPRAARDWLRAAPARVLASLGVRRAVLYERRLEGAVAEPRNGSLRHGWATPDEVAHLAAAAGRKPHAELDRLAAGERCFATFLAGTPIGFRWVAVRRVQVEFLRIGLALPERDVWVSDSWTEPSRRGRGVSSAATRALGAQLVAEGARRTVAIVMVGNRAGHAALSRAGYSALGTITTVRTPRGRAVRFRRAQRS